MSKVKDNWDDDSDSDGEPDSLDATDSDGEPDSLDAIDTDTKEEDKPVAPGGEVEQDNDDDPSNEGDLAPLKDKKLYFHSPINVTRESHFREGKCQVLYFTGNTMQELESWPGSDLDNVTTGKGIAYASVPIKGRPPAVDPLLTDQILQEMTDVKNNPSSDVQRQLLDVAERNNHKTGIWFFFYPCEDYAKKEKVRIWQRLCKDAVHGVLPRGVVDVSISATVTDGKAREAMRAVGDRITTLFQLHVSDYTNRPCNAKIPHYLSKIGVRGKVMLKADLLTLAGVYVDSKDKEEKRIRATLFDENRFIRPDGSIERVRPFRAPSPHEEEEEEEDRERATARRVEAERARLAERVPNRGAVFKSKGKKKRINDLM